MKTCYIFGAASGLPKNFKPSADDLIIAADAGYLTLQKMGAKPHITVGDFDSMDNLPTDTEIIKHPIRKDDTDTLLAVKIGLEKEYKRFFLYGCTGGRLDHTLANLQTLSFIASKGATGYLYGEDFTATVLSGSSLEFPEEKKGNISVFSATDECEISIDGLSYTLNHEKITYNFPLGVSNKFIGKNAKITVHNGTAIIIWQN